MKGVVLNRVGVIGYFRVVFCPKQSQGFKPSVPVPYPDTWVKCPPPPRRKSKLIVTTNNIAQLSCLFIACWHVYSSFTNKSVKQPISDGNERHEQRSAKTTTPDLIWQLAENPLRRRFTNVRLKYITDWNMKLEHSAIRWTHSWAAEWQTCWTLPQPTCKMHNLEEQ